MFAAMWQRTFLYRVWQKDKLLFTLFALFILGQLFFTYKGVENTPFFHYGMYSATHPAHDSYTVYRIEIDTTPVLSGNNTISEYDGMKQQGFKDSLDKVISHRFSGSTAEKLRSVLLNTAKMDTPYQKWLFSYIADMRMIETPYMSVYKQQVGYTTDGKLIPKQPREAVFKLRE
jgi:hypothetical protein